MYTDFSNLDDLIRTIEIDKQADGAGAITKKRYPIRFVLFDNFADSYAFVMRLIQDSGIKITHLQKWLPQEYEDCIISHTNLADIIASHIHELQGKSTIITPFSELARFYDNGKYKQFDALIKTIKSIESTDEAWTKRQRIYIPIIGLEGKMAPFFKDTQTTIWYLHSDQRALNYRLILANSTTFGVENLECKYSVLTSVKGWLDFWLNREKHYRQDIICTSPAIYAYADYAQPDNAFSFQQCDTAYDFLTKGLCLDINSIEYKKEDEKYWCQFAKEIDIAKPFSFTDFINRHFSISTLSDYRTFVKLWFEHGDAFSRWLLVNAWCSDVSIEDYIYNILHQIKHLSDQDFISCVALYISQTPKDIAIRRFCMQQASDRGIKLSNETEDKMCNLLHELSEKDGYQQAISLFTSLTHKEKEIAISWLGKGYISSQDVTHFYPELHYYLQPTTAELVDNQLWCLKYIDEYKKAKISNVYSDTIREMLSTYNKSAPAFAKWYQTFPTTANILSQRNDIDVYYWIDGLGIDWISLLRALVEQNETIGIYVNEIRIARSTLPSITAANKQHLERLTQNGSSPKKLGDLDSLAHRNDLEHPRNIIEEIDILSKSIRELLQIYSGKKIAIISDHGLSYLCQLNSGLNLAGIRLHHNGRYAECPHSLPRADENYITLDDDKTICALNHRSLGAKVHKGCGAHGGCTPEEVLIPVLVISSSPTAKSWRVDFLNKQVSGTDPVVHMRIIGLTSMDSPKLKYNGRLYSVCKKENNLFDSDRLDLDPNATEIELIVGKNRAIADIIVQTGGQMDDLFKDMF